MNFWVVSPNVSNIVAEEPLWKKAILEKKLAFMGWDEDHKLGERFVNEIENGDFILVAQGANRQKKMFIGGIVSSEAIWAKVENTPGEAYYRVLSSVISKEELENIQLDFLGTAYGDANRIPALYRLYPDRNNADKKLTEKLQNSLLNIIKKQFMQEKIRLLERKYQIILQGPPGTGKTRLAKELAKEITKESILKSPLDKINDFFRSLPVVVSQEVLEKRKKLEGYLKDFQQTFKKEDLSSLSLDRYSFGNGANNSFCWWIEYGLYELGGYTGQAGKFKIYWKKSNDTYAKIGFIKDVEDDNEAMKLIAEQLENVVNERDLIQVSEKLSRGFILKILHSYFPEKYFPINNEKCINNALKVLGKQTDRLNVFEKNMALQKAFEEKRKEFNADITNYEFMVFLFVAFDMKGEINIQNDGLVSKGEYKLIQFHPAYSYEDFVRGITAETNKNSQVEYKVVNKLLCEFAQKALDNRSAKYVLIIDEINRANLPSVLGELIYALEYRFDETNVDETTVESMYALKQDNEDEEGDKILRLPKNLYIIGTMNTADRSVGHIDYAIRRRFAFVDVPPSDTVIDKVVIDPELKIKAKELYKKVADLFHEKENEADSKAVYIQSDFKAKDVQLGHSYFLADNEEQLELKLKFEVKPLLYEYVKDGILNEIALDVIDKL